MKKAIQLMLAASLTLTACSEKETIYVVTKEAETSEPKSNEGSQATLRNALNLDYLLSGPSTNLALAEILVPELVKRNFLQASPKDSLLWKESEGSLQQVLTNSRYSLLASESQIFANLHYWKQTLAENLNVSKAAGVFNEKVKLERLTKANNESLQRIFDLFNKELTKNSRLIAKDIVSDPSNGDLIAKIDAVVSKEAQARAKEILDLLIVMDKRLATYNLPESDNAKLLIYSAVAVQLADVLKDNTSVKAIMNVAMEAGKVAQKAREVLVMTRALDEYRISIKQDWDAIGSSFSGMMNGLRQAQFDIEKAKLLPETKKGIAEAVGDILLGKEIKEKENATSFLSAKYKIPENVETFVKRSANAASTLDKMLTITEGLTSRLGIELSPDARKVIEGARKVSDVIQVGNAVMGAFASQGLVGAVGILSGGGGVALLASAAMPDPGTAKILGELRDIKKDLKEIKQDVALIVEMQRTSLAVLKEIAVMIDRNHKDILRELGDVRAEVLENRKLLATTAFSYLSQCGLSMLNSDPNADLSLESYKQAKANLKGNELIYLNSSYKKACAAAVSQAFGLRAGDLTKNSYHVTDSNQDMLLTEKKIYASTLKYFSMNTVGSDWQTMGLHIPMASYKAVSEIKIRFLNLTASSDSNNISDLEGLISPEVLEMYVVALLHSHALIGLPDNFLEQVDAETIKLNIEYSTEMSRRLLQNALYKVNISIAQQSLRSGEPLLPVLNRDLMNILNDKTNCEANPSQGYCFIRLNTVMMGNLLRYRGEFPDVATSDRLVVKDGKEFLRIGPALETIQMIDVAAFKGHAKNVSFDPSIVRLLELQSLLSAEITKVSKLNLSDKLKDALKVGFQK